MGQPKPGRQKTRCPECLAPVWLKDDIELWDPVTCSECHTALQVIRLHPLKLDYLDDEDGWNDKEDDWENEEEW